MASDKWLVTSDMRPAMACRSVTNDPPTKFNHLRSTFVALHLRANKCRDGDPLTSRLAADSVVFVVI